MEKHREFCPRNCGWVEVDSSLFFSHVIHRKSATLVSAVPTSLKAGRGIRTGSLFIQNVVFLEKRRFRYKIASSPIFQEHARNQDDDGELEEKEDKRHVAYIKDRRQRGSSLRHPSSGA